MTQRPWSKLQREIFLSVTHATINLQFTVPVIPCAAKMVEAPIYRVIGLRWIKT